MAWPLASRAWCGKDREPPPTVLGGGNACHRPCACGCCSAPPPQAAHPTAAVTPAQARRAGWCWGSALSRPLLLPPSEIFPYLVVVIGLENVLVLTKSVVSTPVDLEVKLRIAQGMGRGGVEGGRVAVLALPPGPQVQVLAHVSVRGRPDPAAVGFAWPCPGRTLLPPLRARAPQLPAKPRGLCGRSWGLGSEETRAQAWRPKPL